MVLDASVVGAWFIEGQDTPAADDLLSRAHGLAFAAPSNFPLEVANVFLTAERRKRSSPERTRGALERLGRLTITVTEGDARADAAAALELARAEGLTSYDAMYLRLALELRLALASKDGALLDAAHRRGVAVEDLR